MSHKRLPKLPAHAGDLLLQRLAEIALNRSCAYDLALAVETGKLLLCPYPRQ